MAGKSTGNGPKPPKSAVFLQKLLPDPLYVAGGIDSFQASGCCEPAEDPRAEDPGPDEGDGLKRQHPPALLVLVGGQERRQPRIFLIFLSLFYHVWADVSFSLFHVWVLGSLKVDIFFVSCVGIWAL